MTTLKSIAIWFLKFYLVITKWCNFQWICQDSTESYCNTPDQCCNEIEYCHCNTPSFHDFFLHQSNFKNQIVIDTTINILKCICPRSKQSNEGRSFPAIWFSKSWRSNSRICNSIKTLKTHTKNDFDIGRLR